MPELCLDLAELNTAPPEPVQKAVRQVPLNQYPGERYDTLQDEIATYCGVAQRQVVLGNGADEIIDLVTRCVGGTTVIPTPTFGQYAAAAEREGASVVRRNMLDAGSYRFAMDKRDTGADLVWLCTPNNPTGTVIGRDTIQAAVERVEGLVAVDECYIAYGGETVTGLVSEYENLLVLRSFSKDFGLAGLRLGAAIGSEELVDRLREMRQPFSVNRGAVEAGIAALRNQEAYEEIWEQVLATGERFATRVNEAGLSPFPVNANFVLVDAGTTSNARTLFDGLQQRGIGVFPGWDEEFTGLPDRYLRFTVGSPEEMEQVADVVERIVDEKDLKGCSQ